MRVLGSNAIVSEAEVAEEGLGCAGEVGTYMSGLLAAMGRTQDGSRREGIIL